MFVVFSDDSECSRPTRPGMAHLFAFGGFGVDAEKLNSLERHLEDLCRGTGFPKGGEFKWSPSRHLWMYDNLKGEEREAFFVRALGIGRDHGIQAFVVVVEEGAAILTSAPDNKMDAFELFLERASNLATRSGTDAIVIVDEPGGDSKQERAFTAELLEARMRGTNYVDHKPIAQILTAKSEFSRSLQLADLIVSCTTQRVGGEKRYSPPVFSEIASILRRDTTSCGGVGLKIHPDFRFANLYYWLVADTHIWRGRRTVGEPLPCAGLYSSGEYT